MRQERKKERKKEKEQEIAKSKPENRTSTLDYTRILGEKRKKKKYTEVNKWKVGWAVGGRGVIRNMCVWKGAEGVKVGRRRRYFFSSNEAELLTAA